MLQLSDKKKDQLRKGIGKHKTDILQLLGEEKPLEAVSEDLIRELLIDAFGYKRGSLHSQERIVKSRVDIFISDTTKSGIMCECKRYNARKSELDKESTQNQLHKYCKKKGCEWGVLTDAIRWQFYRYDTKHNELLSVLKVDFSDIGKHSISKSYYEQFLIFHADIKENVRRAYAERQEALSKEKLYWLLHDEGVQQALRKEICKRSNVQAKKQLKDALKERINELFPITGRKPYQRKKKQNKKQEEK